MLAAPVLTLTNFWLFTHCTTRIYRAWSPKKTSSEQQQLSCVEDFAASLSVAAEKMSITL